MHPLLIVAMIQNLHGTLRKILCDVPSSNKIILFGDLSAKVATNWHA